MLKTKTHIPRPASNLVHRKDLFEKLQEGLNRKLILISAPAGFGKSCLISDWLDRENIPACWFSLDIRDNDPKEFLRYFITAAQNLNKEIGISSLNLIDSPEKIKMEVILELLANDLFKIKDHSLIILDDYHLINSSEINDIILFILDNLPDKIHIVITTRSDPPFSISRLRSQNQILEFRASELSFTIDPIKKLFNDKLNFNLPDEEIELLRLKTEGWIAGLQLIAISMQNRENHAQFIRNLTGDNRYIMDYLIEEVLNTLPEDHKHFLINTSIFEQVSGTFCNHVLNREDCQEIIESLERNNMFIIPLDSNRNWYRYHHLFADLLKQKLISNNSDHIRQLRIKASEWYKSEGNHLPAIENLLEVKEYDKAIILLNEISDDLIIKARHYLIYKLGNQFKDPVLIRNPHFAINYAWVLIVFGEVVKAMKLLNEVQKFIIDNESHKEDLSKLYLTYGLFFIFTGETNNAIKYSELALKEAYKKDSYWDIWTHIAFGEVSLLKFELDDGYSAYMQALEISRKIGNQYLVLISAAKASYVLLLKGRFTDSYNICNDLLEEIRSNKTLDKLSSDILSSVLYAVMGYILTEWNLKDKGLKYAQMGYELSQNAVSISFKGYCSLLLAETLYIAGEYQKSLENIVVIRDNYNMKVVQWLNVLSFSLINKLKLKIGNEVQVEYNDISLEDKREALNKFENYYLTTVNARWFIHEFKTDEALKILDKLAENLEQKGINSMLVEVELLRAKVYKLQGDEEKAIGTIIKVLNLSFKEKYVRIFISEGEEIQELIKMIPKERIVQNPKARTSVSKQYVEKLLEAFSKEKDQSDVILLSSRELDVLKLIAEDMSNQEISDTLFISLNTVKTHIKNIHLKLDVDSRAKAVTKARELGLL